MAAREEGIHCGAARKATHDYERGRIPHPSTLRWLAEALGVALEELVGAAGEQRRELRRQQMLRAACTEWPGLSDDIFFSPSGLDCARLDDDVERRAFLLRLAVTGGTATAGALLSPGLQGLGSARVAGMQDGHDLEGLTSITGRYRRLESTVPAQALLSPAIAHLQFVSRLLNSARSEGDQVRLAGAASEAGAFAGWLLFDAGDYRGARRYHGVALGHAERAGNEPLRSYIFGCMSFCAEAVGNGDEAVRLAEHSKRLLPKDAPAGPQAWVAVVEASAHARRANMPAALRALKRAEAAVQGGQEGDEGSWPWVFSFDPGRLARYQGACAARLNLPNIALPKLQEGLEELGPQATKRRARTLSDLAEAHVLSGEIEEACRLAGEAFTIGIQRGSRSVLGRVEEVRARLDPWKDAPAVKELDEFLLASFLHPS